MNKNQPSPKEAADAFISETSVADLSFRQHVSRRGPSKKPRPVYFGHDGFEHLTKPEFDYPKLLAAYMAHVIAHEGISFLEYSVPFETEFDALSEAELAELERIEAEVRISSVV